MAAFDEVPVTLRDLWRQRIQVLASNVASGVREHREILHAAALIQQDYHGRFLIELLQNANDQALLAGEHDSTVVVVRTRELLAVTNGGEAVTARNLERLSSLADSDKNGQLLGNKGVGFKAVYQITDVPEVYSTSPGTGSDGRAHLRKDFGLGFALESHPFENPAFARIVEDDVRSHFRENAGLASAIAERGFTDPVEALRAEYPFVAGFKFPMPRDRAALDARVEALRLPSDLLASMRTAVILPLRDDQARGDVEKALDTFLGEGLVHPGQAELAMLFLRGISTALVFDHVRGRSWSFGRSSSGNGGGPTETAVTFTDGDGASRTTRYWLLQRDAVAGDHPAVGARRNVISDALLGFGLEAWNAGDPIPVTVAIPLPATDNAASLGTAGRFCLGLPTQEQTGLPAHVDARFFATISRTGLAFDIPYNQVLLDVAVELFGELVAHLQRSVDLATRRAATLALERTEGALADRVFSPGGLADGKVILTWGGLQYAARASCVLPNAPERALLVLVRDSLGEDAGFAETLPEEGLLTHASAALESIGVRGVGRSPHPWLLRRPGTNSLVERAARLRRGAGPAFWEPFVSSLLDCFSPADLMEHSWLPVGAQDLTSPSQRAFLPAPSIDQGDDEEVADVPARVAGMIRLLDGRSMRLREDGRKLTALAQRLVEARLVRRPRTTELLEDAVFPALRTSGAQNEDLAVELFSLALSWITTMRDLSRKKLDCKDALAPVGSWDPGPVTWRTAGEVYLGTGWGIDDRHDQLLEGAYPGRRLLPFEYFRNRFHLAADDAARWRAAAELIGVRALPRQFVIEGRAPPLKSNSQRLEPKGGLAVEDPALDPIYRLYVHHLARNPTSWIAEFDHDVDEVQWIDQLEVPERRRHVVDLMLMAHEKFRPDATVNLRRVNHPPLLRVPQMWAFAIAELDWEVLPAERGSGNAPVRVSAKNAWRLPDASRRKAYAQLLNLIPQALNHAAPLLDALGIPSLDDAPVDRLAAAVCDLAGRLDAEMLSTRRDALSLALELFGRIDERLGVQAVGTWPGSAVLPLRRNHRLESADVASATTRVLFDDEPARTRHLPGIESVWRVPIAREAPIDRLFALFVRTWGSERVLRGSQVQVDVSFSPNPGSSVRFLDWIEREFPHVDVALELAALLTFGGERAVRSERLARDWKAFEVLTLCFGRFADPGIAHFYDKPASTLSVSSMLSPPEVLAATWEVAGMRTRDLWAGYARALQDGTTRSFLREREIGDVELVEIADAAGLNRSTQIDSLAPALHAAWCQRNPGATLDDAATWLAAAGNRPDAIARHLGRPDLAPVLVDALGLRAPEGELAVVRFLELPWTLWQDAVLRRNGQRHVFAETESRYRDVRAHLVATAREIGSREPAVNLPALGDCLDQLSGLPVPEATRHLPLDVARADAAALSDLAGFVASFVPIRSALTQLPSPPWTDELPVPRDATRRGVRLYREVSVQTREVEAVTSVRAVLDVAVRLAPLLGERVDPGPILMDTRLALLVEGAWAHVYSALARLREVIEVVAPETVKRLSSVQGFRDSTTYESLLSRFPEVPRTAPEPPLPRQVILGEDLTEAELRTDLKAGSNGSLGAKLAAAAAQAIDSSILTGSRLPLPSGVGRRKAGKPSGHGAGRKPVQPRREPAIVGDLGEAFVHEWLCRVLGADYGPEGWVSQARERYGFPPCGNDGAGFDFTVTDPEGRLFGVPCPDLLIEVKSTRTSGTPSFPISFGEWECARECHENDDESIYVILRVVDVEKAPRIGDVLLNPFDAFLRGEIHLEQRDFWVTIPPRRVVALADGVVGTP